MSRRAGVIAFAAVLLLAPLEAGAQRRPASGTSDSPIRLYIIRGNVRAALNDAGIEMLKVELRRFTGEVVSTTFTRQNGEFEFNGITSGNYLVVIEERGYESLRENLEVVGSSRIGVNLYLKKISSGPPEPGVSISARELAFPKRARDEYQKGLIALYEKKDFKKSLSHFQRALAEAPGYYEAYFQQGVALNEMGQLNDAEQMFRKTLELADRPYAEPHVALAALLSGQGKFAEAELMARRGMEADAALWMGHYELARALLGLNKTAEAIQSAEESRRRNPEFGPIYLLMANIHIRRKEFPALLKDLDEFLRIDPGGPMSAQARQIRDEVQKALEKQQNAAINPQKP